MTTTLPVVKEAHSSPKIDADRLRQLAFDCGADDAGLVEIGHPGLDDQRADILKFYPKTKALLAIVCRMNREPIRNPSRSVANLEFHTAGEEVNDVCRAVVTALEQEGVPAINPPMGFPMEADRWPEKMWIVSHKPVAVAAGLGMMGIHRNVIHPKFGNFILLGTVLIGAEATEYDRPIDYNPCLSCKLCVAACPVTTARPPPSRQKTSGSPSRRTPNGLPVGISFESRTAYQRSGISIARNLSPSIGNSR